MHGMEWCTKEMGDARDDCATSKYSMRGILGPNRMRNGAELVGIEVAERAYWGVCLAIF